MEKISYMLPNFEGPLDLLLYLISKNKLQINDIKISEILDQYMNYIQKMEEINMEVSSEFLEMAARLIYIKTVGLLPKHEGIEQLKKEIQGQLIEYSECKKVAMMMSERINFGSFTRNPGRIDFDMSYANTHSIIVLSNAYSGIGLNKIKKNALPTQDIFLGIVSKKIISVTSKIVYILRRLWKNQSVNYISLFEVGSSKSEIVALFLAVLELTRSKRIMIKEVDNELNIELIKRGQ